MLKVGITGGIGSGKSYVCSILEHLGFPVFYSDKSAKILIETNDSIKQELIHLFGNEIYKGNKLDKIRLSNLIFTDNLLLEKINSIIHPNVRECFNNWASFQKSNIVFNEAAILFETDIYKTFDYTVLITAPLDLKIERVMKRDYCKKEDVLTRMNNQWTDEQKSHLASFIISNDDKISLISQVDNILKELIHSSNLRGEEILV